jgi:hypothetical protein
MSSHGAQQVLQGLIKWSASLEALATWEHLEALQQCFLHAPACPQAGLL